MLHWSYKKVKNNKAPTGSHNKKLPPDFVEGFAAYWKQDEQLYRLAGDIFDAHLDRIPQCRG